MKRVGIVTWYWGNYGSILQAYALQSAISAMEIENEIIQHHVNSDIKTQLKYRVFHNGLLKTFAYYKNKINGRISQRQNMNELKDRENVFQDFIRDNLILSNKKYNNKNYISCNQYDTYICGSDQIWNPNFTFLSPFYWLAFVEKKTKISYAPSMGNALLKNNEVKLVKKYLESFSAISVRESSGASKLCALLEKNVVTVSDPTMLIKADEWKKKIPNRSIKEKYLFAYLIRGNIEQRSYIQNVAKERGLTLVTYPYLEGNAIENDEKKWGDIRCFEDSPFDFLEKINNADIIITDSFHCSVFSLLFHKNFCVMKKAKDHTSQFGRLEQLLGMCSEKQRIIDIDTSFKMLNDNFEISDLAIEKIREFSLKYLKDALTSD